MASSSRREIRVLHVDDEPARRDLTRTCLERNDEQFTVETAASAGEGLERLDDCQPDCIVSDYEMPEMDGLEFLEAVRAEHPDLPFVLFTGKGSETVASDAISAGITDYLQKSGSAEQYELLANRVRNAVSQYRSKSRLRETKEEYATVFESALTGLLLVDVEPDGFRYQRCNPKAIELIGRERAAIVGNTPCEALGTENGKKVRGAYRRCVDQGEPVEYTVDLELPVGPVTRPSKVTPVASNGGIGQLVVSFYDATEQRRQQAQLERQNDLFRKAQELANVGAWEYDVKTDQTAWTDQVYEIHDRPRESSTDNDAIIELYHPDDRAALREGFCNAVDGGEPYDLELRLQTTDGETRWVSTRGQPQTADGEVVRVRGAVQDITDRKERTTEILELKRQYQTLSENIPNGAVFLLNEDLEYVRARGTELEAVGLSPDEIEGASPHEVFPDHLADELVEYFADALDGKSHAFTQSLGESVYRVRTVPVENSDGAVTHGIALSQNVTDQVEREQELEAQNERLEEFASVVSHDLRNPLQTATGRLTLAQEECDSTHLEHVADALERSQALVDDLLVLARGGDTVESTEAVSVPALTEECWQVIPGDDATLVVESDQTVPADRSRLRQVLENLFANAVRHGGTDVTVRVGDLPDGFYVSDDGPGVPESERAEIFGAGYSTTEGGTGFGLRVVRQVVDDHGWEVAVTDSEDRGARVEITGVDTVE